MAYKMKGSPLNQFGMASSVIGNAAGLLNATQVRGSNTRGVGGAGAAALASQAALANQANGTVTPTNAMSTAPVPKANTSITPRVTQKYTPSKPIRVTGTRAKPAQPIPAAVNPSAMQPAPINPKAIGNPTAVQGIYGNANADTFTRTVPGNEAPIMQLANPELLQDGPQLPPQGVETSVTPTLGFENS